MSGSFPMPCWCVDHLSTLEGLATLLLSQMSHSIRTHKSIAGDCCPWQDSVEAGGAFSVMQPGSSVATALSEGEAKRKHVVVLEIMEQHVSAPWGTGKVQCKYECPALCHASSHRPTGACSGGPSSTHWRRCGPSSSKQWSWRITPKSWMQRIQRCAT